MTDSLLERLKLSSCRLREQLDSLDSVRSEEREFYDILPFSSKFTQAGVSILERTCELSDISSDLESVILRINDFVARFE